MIKNDVSNNSFVKFYWLIFLFHVSLLVCYMLAFNSKMQSTKKMFFYFRLKHKLIFVVVVVFGNIYLGIIDSFNFFSS